MDRDYYSLLLGPTTGVFSSSDIKKMKNITITLQHFENILYIYFLEFVINIWRLRFLILLGNINYSL